MKGLLGLLFVSVVGLASCDNYKEVKTEDLNRAFILNSSETFKGYYYRGSDNDFNYFVTKWDFEEDRHFKIAADKLQINDSLKFTKDERELRIDVYKVDDNKEFAKNEFYTLYIIKDK